MQQRHKDRKQYFNEQGITTEKYVIPYIESIKSISKESRILEIGCGEGGNLVPFMTRGCEVVGVDLNSTQIKRAKDFFAETVSQDSWTLLDQNIYDVTEKEIGKFDIVMMRDVIEHIPNQSKFLGHLQLFLKEDGHVFFGFPPWTMPFGGHQQICRSKLLSKLPYFHLLPTFLYRGILKLFGEPQGVIKELIEIKQTGIGINRFLRIIEKNQYEIAKKTYYLINPNYDIKFGLTPRIQYRLIAAIPYLRDFLTTCCYCIIKIKETK